jgi:hypothetical protein
VFITKHQAHPPITVRRDRRDNPINPESPKNFGYLFPVSVRNRLDVVALDWFSVEELLDLGSGG